MKKAIIGLKMILVSVLFVGGIGGGFYFLSSGIGQSYFNAGWSSAPVSDIGSEYFKDNPRWYFEDKEVAKGMALLAVAFLTYKIGIKNMTD